MVPEINNLYCSELHQNEGPKGAYYRVTLGLGVGAIVCKTISLETMGWFFL